MGSLYLAVTDKHIFMCYESGEPAPKIGKNEDPDVAYEIIDNYIHIEDYDFEKIVLNVIPNPKDSIFWNTYQNEKILSQIIT